MLSRSRGRRARTVPSGLSLGPSICRVFATRQTRAIRLFFPVPVKTSTRTDGSASTCAKVSRNTVRSIGSSRLCSRGRFSRTTTRPGHRDDRHGRLGRRAIGHPSISLPFVTCDPSKAWQAHEAVAGIDGCGKILVLFELMRRSVRYVAPFWILMTVPALAQTTATPGSATRGGVVSLGTGAATSTTTTVTSTNPVTSIQSTPATATSAAATGSTTGTSTTGSASAGGAIGTRSSAPGGARSTSSSTATSGGSSGTGAAATSSKVPAWLLCPPSGASGMQPFFTGTDLSCAP